MPTQILGHGSVALEESGDGNAAAAAMKLDLDSLPISEHRDRILSAVERNQVTCIQGETGCGKSSMVPQFLVDHGIANSRPGFNHPVVFCRARARSVIFPSHMWLSNDAQSWCLHSQGDRHPASSTRGCHPCSTSGEPARRGNRQQRGVQDRAWRPCRFQEQHGHIRHCRILPAVSLSQPAAFLKASTFRMRWRPAWFC